MMSIALPSHRSLLFRSKTSTLALGIVRVHCAGRGPCPAIGSVRSIYDFFYASAICEDHKRQAGNPMTRFRVAFSQGFIDGDSTLVEGM